MLQNARTALCFHHECCVYRYLMTQKAREFRSHDNTFVISTPRADINLCGCSSKRPINVSVCFQLIGSGEGSTQPNTDMPLFSNGKTNYVPSSIQSMIPSASLNSQLSILYSSTPCQLKIVTPSSYPSGKFSSMPSIMPKDSLLLDNKFREGCNITLTESPCPWYIKFDCMNNFITNFVQNFGYIGFLCKVWIRFIKRISKS